MRIDAQLLENIVLPLDARHGLLDVGEDGPLQQKPRAASLEELAEDLLVEGLGDGLPLLLRIAKPLQSVEERLPRIEHFDVDAQSPKHLGDLACGSSCRIRPLSMK